MKNKHTIISNPANVCDRYVSLLGRGSNEYFDDLKYLGYEICSKLRKTDTTTALLIETLSLY